MREGLHQARPATVTRLDSLTGLRFFAALLVFGFHAAHYRGGDGFNPFDAGMTGVSFFYIVSGFVLAWSAQRETGLRTFYRRRIARIYPAYLCAWLISLVLLSVTGEGVVRSDLFAPTLLQAWVPDESVYFSASAVFWSLSVEAFFYAVFPLIYPRMNRLGVKALWVACGICVALNLVFAVVVDLFFDLSQPEWVITIFPPARLPEFVLGMAMALALSKIGRRGRQTLSHRIRLVLTAPIAIAAVLAAGYAPSAYSRSAVTVAPFAALVLGAAVADVRRKKSPLRARWLVSLGVWSYCFYLIHTQVLVVWAWGLGIFSIVPSEQSVSVFAALWILALGGSVLAAYLLHIIVERPGNRLLRPKGRALAD